MAIILPNEGETNVLDAIAAKSLTVRLYTAVVGGVIDEATVLSDFTEADFPGYSADAITATSGWTVAAGDPSTMTADAASVFTRAAGAGATDDCLGYYVEDTVAGEVVWAEEFASSIPITNENDQITLTAALTLADTSD